MGDVGPESLLPIALVDATAGDILEVGIGSARPDAERDDVQTDRSGSGSGGQ